MIVLRVLLVLGGIALVVTVVLSAIRTVIVPRGEVVLLTRVVFRSVRRIFDLFAREVDSYERRDRVIARFAPTALMTLPIVWAVAVLFGFAAIYWGIDERSWQVVLLSGSSLTTLGFQRADHDTVMMISVLEGLIGLLLVALLISFLPTIYGHFSRREVTVRKLFTRAEDEDGVIRPAALILRAYKIGGLDRLNDELWPEWEQWFVEVSESHVSFPALVFFRSPSPRRSWVTSAGVALDSASLLLSTLDVGRQPRAALMIRSGYESLRDIADYFSLPYNPDPSPDDPICVTRDEYFEVYDRLAEAGVPVRDDREKAWRDYQGWRVNYDELVTSLSSLTLAPYAPWISDRSVPFRLPTLRASMRASRGVHIR
jgi:hypothetical protein